MAVRAKRRRRKSRVRLLVVLGSIVVIAAVVWVRAQPVLGGVVVVVVLSAVAAAPLRRAWRRRVRAEPGDRRIRAAVIPAEVNGSPLGFAAATAMTGRQFEERIRLLLEQDGCDDVRIVGGAGDRGADLTAISPYGDRVVVQCKRYKAGSPVRDPDMQRFLGTARLVHNAAIPLYVTTSRFTPAAVRLAREHGIVLVDGVTLEAWIKGGPSPLPREPTEHVG
jgi:restriction system protein